MCRSRTKLSWRDILNLGVGEHSVAEVTAQKPGCIKVDGPAKNTRQLILHREEVEAGNVSGLEFHDHVHVTVWQKIVAQNRAEEREPTDVMPSAEGANAFHRYVDSCAFHLNIPRIPPLTVYAPIAEYLAQIARAYPIDFAY
jgi:hypothetical protein